MKVCIVVDGISSGKFYPALFKQKGYPCVHIYSSSVSVKTGLTVDEKPYIDSFSHDGNISNTLEKLKKYEVVCVVAGSEPGVLFADLLSASLKMPTSNGIKKSSARRNKYDMDEALKAHDLKTPLYFKSKNVDEIIQWVHSNTTWPVVVKALESAGTDGVFICANENEIKNGFSNIFNKNNCLGSLNEYVLVQSFLKGDEYVINSVSYAGKHYVTDIWKYRKKTISGQGTIYDRDELISFEGEIQTKLVSYTHHVLDALEIQYGPSHAEVIITPEGEPVLVEVGARLSGGTDMAVSNECIGNNAVQLSVDCYTDQKSFQQAISQPFTLKKYALIIELSNEQEGILTDIPFADEIKKISSVRAVTIKAKKDTYLKKTTDLFSSLASIQLVHESKEQLENDYLAIQKMKSTGFIVKPLEEKKRNQESSSLLLAQQGLFSSKDISCSKNNNTNHNELTHQKIENYSILFQLLALTTVAAGLLIYWLYQAEEDLNPLPHFRP